MAEGFNEGMKASNLESQEAAKRLFQQVEADIAGHLKNIDDDGSVHGFIRGTLSDGQIFKIDFDATKAEFEKVLTQKIQEAIPNLSEVTITRLERDINVSTAEYKDMPEGDRTTETGGYNVII